MSKPIVMERGVKYRDADKMALIRLKMWSQSATLYYVNRNG
ncbi:lipoic acid synthetase [Salmonella enterica subsp. enterica serovar Daytona]|uniref:Lipoic acid synthetase n=1 Tax=Salmonella enterica subsp. enterica serovar Daytona TaxID=1962639 RepID=A0A447JLC9_SALET|nr:lipoic acid synthetase [Salmonella enterica subsp. enterica serovar Daytona]